MLKTLLRRGLAALGIAFAAGCATTPSTAAPPAAKPALWQVADEDTTIYLFGTIHMLPKDYAWQTPTFERVVAGSQALVVETILDETNPQAIAMELARLGISPGLPPIAERVAPEKRPLLEAAIAKTGIPRPAFDRMETWAASFMLLGTQFKELGVTGADGVESVLRARFKAAGKPILQLESNSEQLGFFDTLPEGAQRKLLESTLESPDEMRKEFGKMVAEWARGDVDAIARSFNQHLSETPELKAALIERRNANWSRWIEQRLASPGTTLVAVGAGHLAGDDSVQELLEERGYKVRRLQ